MKLNKITEWIKKQITRHKKDKGQVSQEPEQQEEIKERIVADCTVNVDALAEARAKLGQAGYTIGEKKEKQKELSMSNNRRKMKGIPMIRQQQLRRAQRNRRKKTNGWQQLGERKYWNQEENAWYTHKQ
ncbi:hypothetical protein DWY46_16550 [Blautia obeum]|jgi:hypothetical protein|uniref:Uncharacterized protein n=1 Tax=Blautia obeum TaxID=40520 RepID=A0A412EM86_9FIRM|nr:hypothetical protein [Blautia obeum]RGR45795.1 hypothetical protein DWY46_16550 [Blautia obeum]